MEAWIGLENSKDVGVVRMERAVDRMLAEGFGYSLVRIGDFGIRRTGGARPYHGRSAAPGRISFGRGISHGLAKPETTMIWNALAAPSTSDSLI